MWKGLYFSTLFFLITQALFAQTIGTVITGRVTDINHTPMPFVAIQNAATGQGVLTNRRGQYSLSTTIPATIKVSYLGYKSIVQKMETVGNNDTIVANFVLKTDSAQLQSVQITASNKPELVKESPALEDFEIRYGKIWILNDYSKGDRLEVYDSSMKFLAGIILKQRADSLLKTPHNILYIAFPDSVRIFAYYTNLHSIYSLAIARGKFLPNLTGLVAYSYPFYYYAISRDLNSSIVYYYYNKIDSMQEGLYSYRGKALESRNKATLNPDDNPVLLGYSIWGNIANLSGGIYHPPSVSEIVEKASEEFNPMIIAKQELIDLYCPLRIIRDSIYIFNFDNDSIYVFTPANKFYRSMPLLFDVHGLKYKQRDILVNDEGTACYFKFEERGAVYLRQIDLNTGKAASTEKLGEQFPNKIRILGDYAYYTCTQEGEYKNFTVHLYRQKL